MEGAIDANVALDYAEFQLFPSHDRYEACICSGNKIETIASGLLGQLVLHSPEIKDLICGGSIANFKLQPPRSLDGLQWFTKSTLIRFLHLLGSPSILYTADAIQEEINQLKEAREFHLTLYTKDNCYHSGDETRELKDEVKIASSDASKNELLRAIELRLKALGGELTAAFNQAAGATCSSKHISDMEKLSQHFGAINLRNTLRKFVEHNQMDQKVDLSSDKKSPSTIDSINDTDSEVKVNAQILKLSLSVSDTPVKYGVSPAKAAEVERQSSTESEESSPPSGDDQPSEERSRTLIRSASPRRSASPMRRVQIGRSGSRRATALTIRSLNYIPARDNSFPFRDATANSGEDEGSEQPPKRTDSNVGRISVQDAISLFENKQKDQTSDVKNRRFTIDTFSGTKRSALRRWSAGTGESSTQDNQQIVSENIVPMPSDHSEAGEIPRSSSEAKYEPEFISGDNNPVEAANMYANLVTFEERTEKLTASAEWNRQKELELNQMLMKMMESKPVKYRNIASDNTRSQDVLHEQKAGVSDHYKEKKDEKVRGEAAGKLAENEAQFRAMQKILDERKTEMASAKKSSLVKPKKSHKSVTQSANPQKESSKPAVAKKALSKTSPLPAVRKSWPSTPSPRATTGPSPAKTPCGTSSTGTTPTRQKNHPVAPVPQSSPKVKRSIQRPKNVKASPNDTGKIMKDVTQKQQQALTKNGKTAKTKVQAPPGKEEGSVVAAKPSFYSKVTKNSSVVPLESKPFLRKGSGIGPGVGPVVIKTKGFSQPEETSENSEKPVEAQKDEVVTDNSDFVSQQQEGDFVAVETNAGLEPETHELTSQQKCEETVSSKQVASDFDGSFVMVTDSVFKTEEEKTVISPTAWVEIEEHQDLPIPQAENTCEISSAASVAPMAISSPRVRHSLSQMLLEESAETDVMEWGNAENPAAMIYQKDAPKGLKRLLNFARKSKADPNPISWSSPVVFSGEDDAKKSNAVSKKNPDNLRRKAALHGKNYGHRNSSLGEGYQKDLAGSEIHSAHSNVNKFSGQSSSHKLQDHILAATNTTKATRSFFPLSAFRGGKPNEAKLP